MKAKTFWRAVAFVAFCLTLGHSHAATVARIYATTSDKGVKAYRVDNTNAWMFEKTVISPGDGHTVKPVSCVHGPGCFYVLDADSTTSTASFSIHRYGEDFKYIDTLVSSYTPGTAPNAQQMAISPDGTYLYVACMAGGVLYRVSTSDGTIASFATAGINNSRSVCTGTNGTVYVANRGTSYAASYDKDTGERTRMYTLSSASGVFFDDTTGRIYISNSGNTLQSYKADGSDGVALTDSKLGNAIAVTRAGDCICVGLVTGHVVAYDRTAGTFGYAVTSIGSIWQLTAEAHNAVCVTLADGGWKRYGTFAEATAATGNSPVAAMSVMPADIATGALVAAPVSLTGGKFGKGTRFNREPSEAEVAALVADGLYVREVATASGTAWEVSGVYAAARVYATIPGVGVKSWLVDCTNRWTSEGTVLSAGDGHVVRPMAVARIGAFFHVLDRLDTAETKFSIHRYDTEFRYVDTPLANCSSTSPNVQQMAASPDGAYLYVTCFSGGSLLRVKVSDWSVESFATMGVNVSRGISVAANGTIYVAQRGASYAAVYDKDSGSRLKYHSLSQASGVLFHEKTKRVFVTNTASTIKVFNESDASGVGGVEYSSSLLGNAFALAAVGDIVYVGNSSGKLTAFDPAAGTFTKVADVSSEINHLFADNPCAAVVTSSGGAVVEYGSFSAAVATVDSSTVALDVFSGVAGRSPVRFTSLATAGSGETKALAVGTRASRALSVVERLSYLAPGLCTKEEDGAFVVTSAYPVARAYLSQPNYGVRAYIVDSIGQWAYEKDFLVNTAGKCERAAACVRAGKFVYVLDKISNPAPGRFSIWRYSAKGTCLGKLVDGCAVNSSEPWQIAASPDNSYLYVSCATGGAMLRVRISDGRVDAFTTISNDARGICTSADGTIYMVNGGQSAVRSFDPATGTATGYYQLSSASGAWYDDEASRLYVVNTGKSLKWFDAGDTTGTDVTDNLLSRSYALAGFGGYVYSCPWDFALVVSFEPESGTFASVAFPADAHVEHLFFEPLPEVEYPPDGTTVIFR